MLADFAPLGVAWCCFRLTLRLISICPTRGTKLSGKDAVSRPNFLINLAIVYALTNESELTFETVGALNEVSNGIYYNN